MGDPLFLDSPVVIEAAVVLGGYLIGSVDFGVIVPRLAGIEIYQHGSGNPGATNVLRTMGRKAAAVVVLGDHLKGFVAAMAGDLVGGEVLGFTVGFAAVVGHCFPIWHRFKGGKGVAAAGGMVLWLEPVYGLANLTGWFVLALVAKKASLASILVAAALVPGMALFGHRGWSLVWAGATAFLVIARHHENIRRLLRGSEHRIDP